MSSDVHATQDDRCRWQQLGNVVAGGHSDGGLVELCEAFGQHLGCHRVRVAV
jgi:hypothetical protein